MPDPCHQPHHRLREWAQVSTHAVYQEIIIQHERRAYAFPDFFSGSRCRESSTLNDWETTPSCEMQSK